MQKKIERWNRGAEREGGRSKRERGGQREGEGEDGKQEGERDKANETKMCGKEKDRRARWGQRWKGLEKQGTREVGDRETDRGLGERGGTGEGDTRVTPTVEAGSGEVGHTGPERDRSG